ncbi:unnamed protein product [Prunus armeniaca]
MGLRTVRTKYPAENDLNLTFLSKPLPLKLEGYRKDVEKYFGILQAQWEIIRGAACMFDEEVLQSIMMTCIILHYMIVEDEYDYEELEVFEHDPMNTALTRIYERAMGENWQPL